MACTALSDGPPLNRVPSKQTLKEHSIMSELLTLIETESAGIVAETLDFWLYECSLDEAPKPEEVAQWRDILAKRGAKFERLAAICQTWLDEEA